jgi:hypothetical protein
MHQAKNRRASDQRAAGRYSAGACACRSSNWIPSRNTSKPTPPPKPPRLVSPEPLDHLPRFEQTTARVSPASLQGHPMLKQQAQELGVELRQDPLRLGAPPRVNLAFLFPEFPEQLDRPSQAHQGDDLSSREHTAIDVGQHQQPLHLPLFARTHLVALRGLACAGGGPTLAWAVVHTVGLQGSRGRRSTSRLARCLRRRTTSSGRRRAIKRTGT